MYFHPTTACSAARYIYLWKLGEFFICQHGNMAEEFMTAISVGADWSESIKEKAAENK